MTKMRASTILAWLAFGAFLIEESGKPDADRRQRIPAAAPPWRPPPVALRQEFRQEEPDDGPKISWGGGYSGPWS